MVPESAVVGDPRGNARVEIDSRGTGFNRSLQAPAEPIDVIGALIHGLYS
jgi:hypothetical protein